MNVLLLDLWHDLRAKRLAPVAVVLALALLAVPFVLRDGSEAAPVAPRAAAPANEGADKQLAVKALQEASLPSSDLSVFDAKDPFEPLSRPTSPADLSAGKAMFPSANTTPGGAAGATTLPGGSIGGSSSSGGGSGGGGSGGGGSPLDLGGSLSPGSGGGQSPSVPPATTPKRRLYTHAVDLEFGRTGEERDHKGVKRLTLLPSKENPLLVFLGVHTDGKRAIFLAEAGLSQAGEGKCEPDGNTCTFLELQDVKGKDEHFLTDEAGREYRIRLIDIRLVEIKPESKKAKQAAAKRRARSRRRAPADANIFETLLFADQSR